MTFTDIPAGTAVFVDANVLIYHFTAGLVSVAAAISQQHALLSGDALVVAVMREQGLAHLGSHDADFDRVPALTRYAPV